MKRSLKLIANFVDGYAEGWFFAVGDFFRDNLDIKLTDRIVREKDDLGKNKKSTKIYTQGKEYSFEIGDIFYDSPNGYLRWDIALKNFNQMCQITNAVSDQYDSQKKIINGLVDFDLYRVNSERNGLQFVGNYRKTQHGFVKFLATGVL
jgi:hypothetical protein